MTQNALKRVAIVGAHPDDPEAAAGGVAALYRQQGCAVLFVSMTNGDAGHQSLSREALARRRRAETEAVARLLGIEYVVFDVHDGELEPTLEVRRQLIRLLRRFAPDVILTHPPVDYHPDHRYTSQAVCDTAYMLGVPNVCPEVPAIRKRPVYVFFAHRPPADGTFCLAVDVGPVWDRKVAMLACHESQMFEWLPFDADELDKVPADPAGRLEFVSERRARRARTVATHFEARLRELYGAARGPAVTLAEGFMAAPVSTPLTAENGGAVLPFLPLPARHEESRMP